MRVGNVKGKGGYRQLLKRRVGATGYILAGGRVKLSRKGFRNRRENSSSDMTTP